MTQTLEVREETPRGRGAVSVVSVRGRGALERVQALCARASLAVGVPALVRLAPGGDDLDEALVCVLDEGHVEIHVHGSPVLVRALLRSLGAGDATPILHSDEVARSEDAARADEAAFADPSTRSMAPAEQRARLLLERAPSESGARILLDQAEGAWRAALERIARNTDAEVELESLIRASHAARFAADPARVVLAGPVNAGKSTLFNVLAGERRALTSAEPGTTRDLVRATVHLGRHAIDLADTAGERESKGSDPAAEVERAGQRLAREERSRADLVVWLTDASAHTSAAPAGALHVWTRADLVRVAPEPAVSALRDPAGARATIARLVRERLDLPEQPWAPGRAAAFDAPSRAVVQQLSDARRQGTAQLVQSARAALAADPLPSAPL